jgi:3,4-dihydroxy 2-butanone 4-phosphate synthase/GTP cyclohydrolase II
MARLSDLVPYAGEHGLRIVTVADLIKYRRRNEKLIRRAATVAMPTKYGDFKAVGYESVIDGSHHVAMVKGDVAGKKDVLVRVHSECLTGDVFGSLRCDCGEQLAEALKRVEDEGLGVVLYMRQEGRGIGLINKLKAYALQEQGRDTVEANIELGFDADLRDYGVGAQILADLGLSTIRIMTNNPKKIVALEGYGLQVTGREAIEIVPQDGNVAYLRTKREKMGHLLEHEDLFGQEEGPEG